MDTFIAYFNEKDNTLSVFNPYVNDKINYGTLNENTIYITWKRLQGNVHQIVLSEIADMDNIKTEDLWFYVNSQKHPLWATYKAYTLLKEQVRERQVLSQHKGCRLSVQDNVWRPSETNQSGTNNRPAINNNTFIEKIALLYQIWP